MIRLECLPGLKKTGKVLCIRKEKERKKEYVNIILLKSTLIYADTLCLFVCLFGFCLNASLDEMTRQETNAATYTFLHKTTQTWSMTTSGELLLFDPVYVQLKAYTYATMFIPKRF